jgi:hypothetical protein
LRHPFPMQFFHQLHLASAFAGTVVGNGVDATRPAVILLLARRGVSVFNNVGAPTRFAFHGFLQGLQRLSSCQ